MKLFYDHQIFSMQNYGGISRYFVALMNSYKFNREVLFELPLLVSNNAYLEKTEVSCRGFFSNRNFTGKHRLMALLNKLYSLRAIEAGNYDLFHPTYYNPYFLSHIDNKPFVLTIYDMIHEVCGDMFAKSDKTCEYKRLLAQKASKILAISNTTKNDILKFYPEISEDKIIVTPLATSLRKQECELSVSAPDKYILFVGNRSGYKNFRFFIESIQSLLIEDEELNVVCAGGGDFTKEELVFFENMQIENCITYYDINNSILVQLYKEAIAFVFPSLYEGFGIPVLEAFECDCPVVLSNTGSLPEVAGEAGEYFDPEDSESIADSIVKVIYDSQLRNKMIGLGRKRSEQFSWQKTADLTLNAYRDAL